MAGEGIPSGGVSWRIKDRLVAPRFPLVMGILNATPDSFHKESQRGLGCGLAPGRADDRAGRCHPRCGWRQLPARRGRGPRRRGARTRDPGDRSASCTVPGCLAQHRYLAQRRGESRRAGRCLDGERYQCGHAGSRDVRYRGAPRGAVCVDAHAGHAGHDATRSTIHRCGGRGRLLPERTGYAPHIKPVFRTW
jgi:hypothetical protein